MFDFLNKLFDANGFMPRRCCGIWTTGEILLHNFSDAIIWLAYMAIPVVLIYFVRKKRGQVPFPKMFWMFGAFIILCGITHFMDIVMFYHPLYRLAGLLKAVTAGVSLVTALKLVPLVPKALAMRTSEELEREIAERKQAEAGLKKAHKELLEASRLAGMAEVATGVLHNVGNVLNSVNVSATLVADTLAKSKSANLTKAAAMFQEHAADLAGFLTNDPKGKQLPIYLGRLAAHLADEQSGLLKEIAQLRKDIEHIKDIVAMQQSYARVSGVSESIQATELVDDALRLNAGTLTRHDVQVVRQYEADPPLIVDRHKVLQILVNLIRNAKYACDESGRADKQITMRIASANGWVTIAVIDNGVGIPAENLTRIFNHGFTTRKDGHGFGLHSGANAAKEVRGNLTAYSEGPGRGATFILEMPLQPCRSRQSDRRLNA